MLLVMIRHLPTVYNQQGLLQGLRDESILPLAKEAQRQVTENQQRLMDLAPFDKILTSTLKRTAETAQHYQFQGELQQDPLLNELDFGLYEGKARVEMLAEVGEDWIDKPRDLVFGEPFIQLEQRVWSFLAKYQQYPRILGFAHAAWLRALLSVIEIGSVQNMNHFQIANNTLVVEKVSLTRLQQAQDIVQQFSDKK
ncbi:histidine phosphatase family protein [Candidatus Venteria ishoeyi]|uniref:Putative phosphoserine phosphatase 2 n=1 Tax=Candidatus Venteria ishoeyi TaxID=1899563 RepID=A0A1H6F9L9_9GAMM|nr:histidine phosphatase family protein [Candidatus Venteria ishoeyi]SEH06009.1 Putative phosphoserine phosphatase 2 [Candidatus Venteria ishoeyi]SEH07674.1 Putative phosphoserine phosphatase 2 [Candidatus Venteria ishoeyi]